MRRGLVYWIDRGSEFEQTDALPRHKPRSAQVQIRGYRVMDAGQKAELVAELSEAVRQLARAGIRQRHPGLQRGRFEQGARRASRAREIERRLWPGDGATRAVTAIEPGRFLARIAAALDGAAIPHMQPHHRLAKRDEPLPT